MVSPAGQPGAAPLPHTGQRAGEWRSKSRLSGRARQASRGWKNPLVRGVCGGEALAPGLLTCTLQPWTLGSPSSDLPGQPQAGPPSRDPASLCCTSLSAPGSCLQSEASSCSIPDLPSPTPGSAGPRVLLSWWWGHPPFPSLAPSSHWGLFPGLGL